MTMIIIIEIIIDSQKGIEVLISHHNNDNNNNNIDNKNKNNDNNKSSNTATNNNNNGSGLFYCPRTGDGPYHMDDTIKAFVS